MTPNIIERLDTALVEDSADGLFRCDRAIFTDAGFFELELESLDRSGMPVASLNA